MVLRFGGFELDRQRAELRGPDGEAIKLRPKTLSMLALFAANAGRVLSKQELMEAVWPNVHVGDDSLLLAAAYQGSGRPAEARAAMEQAMALRPGSNLGNVALPPKNASAAFLAASERIGRAYVAAGLPER